MLLRFAIAARNVSITTRPIIPVNAEPQTIVGGHPKAKNNLFLPGRIQHNSPILGWSFGRMRKVLLYIGVALVTFIAGGVLHVIVADAYRFHNAAFFGDLATIDDMLARGTSVDTRDNFGATALMYAAEEGHTVIVKRLLSAGADVNAMNDGGLTPLMIAAGGGHVELVDVFLKAGADVNSTWRGWNALMSAAGSGQTVIVEKLLAAGADVNAQPFPGITALMFAAQDGHLDTVNVLLTRGANVNVRRKDGWTPLGLAESRHYPLVVQRLREAGGVN